MLLHYDLMVIYFKRAGVLNLIPYQSIVQNAILELPWYESYLRINNFLHMHPQGYRHKQIT